ncbi:hypothetical protein HPB51_026186 [Rhipicephalus microplus]|uniref:Uncharacterized protein n=1 Tax=Rhipicephalus microplus TaxID=6941 RepID=A0A9J6DX60_RHIMP|nr:hypothetical protein HPB51_026186 [Rhipicephalus microplus]
MRVRPMVGKVAGAMCAVPREDDRRPVFDPRWRRSCSALMGSKPAESSRPILVFIKALDETGNARAVERTTKKTLFECLSIFRAAAGAIKAPSMPALEEWPGVVCVMVKELHQWVDRLPSMGQTCAVSADYLEVHHGLVRRLLSSIGSAVFAGYVSAWGRNISSMKHQFNERARMRFHRLRTDFLYEQNRADERNVRKNLHLPAFWSARSCVAGSSEDWERSARFPESEEALDAAGATSVPNSA